MPEREEKLVEVRQCDREAAARLIEAYWCGADASMMKLAQSYRAGHSQGAFVRAFARHRQAAEAEMIERAAKVADDNRTDDGSMWDRAAETIGRMIRSLKAQSAAAP